VVPPTDLPFSIGVSRVELDELRASTTTPLTQMFVDLSRHIEIHAALVIVTTYVDNTIVKAWDQDLGVVHPILHGTFDGPCESG
jgi:hypothetical protein